MARRLDSSAPGFAGAFDALLNAKREDEEDVAQAVRGIIADVRARGDEAVIELTNKFDKSNVSAATLRLTADEIAAAQAGTTAAQQAALQEAASRIEAYHRRQLPANEWFEDATGARLGWRWTPLDSVGLYVPGGTVELVFAGGGALKLEVECIDAGLTDVSGVWAARGRPEHEET